MPISRVQVSDTTGAWFNSVVGGRKFLLQQNFDYATQECALASAPLPKLSPPPLPLRQKKSPPPLKQKNKSPQTKKKVVQRSKGG
jgi:hypothetical protein